MPSCPSRSDPFETLESRRLLAITHLYTFNDGTANDSVGSAHASLFNGAQISSGRLVLQNAAITSGQSSSVQYAKLPNGVLPTTGSATVEVWYTTFSATPNWMRVFDFGDQTGTSGNSYLFYTPKSSTNVARAGLKPAGATERTASSTEAANHGYMHMAGVVVDATTGNLLLYVDGVLKGSAPLNGSTIAVVNEINAYLGRSQFNSDAGFSGAIDELRIYDEALDAATISAHHAQGAARPAAVSSTRQMEYLNRGVVAINKGGGQVYAGWRLLGTDPAGISFNLYRSTGNGAAIKRNASPITATTDFLDTGVDTKQVNRYFVRPVIGGVEQPPSETFTLGANPTAQQYLSIPMQVPPNGLTRDGVPYHYQILDASPGDLDGDGQYEFVVRWDTVNDGTSSYFGPYILDGYEMDGTHLWRINLGKNISDSIDGILVYDLDGDGKAEVVSRTADGTTSGTGQVIGDPNVDWVNDTEYPVGWVMQGPEYLTVFSGQTGAALATTNFEPARGNLTDWGDNYGQRGHQIFVAPAYLDGQRPSIVFSRGIYFNQSSYPQAQTQMVAYDWRNGQLTKRWHFKAGLGINNNINSNFVGQGNHQISVADVDQDGRDEIINGSMVVDDNGLPLVSTQLEHGDAMHVSDLDPSRPGLEVFGIHENEGTYDPNRPYGAAMYDPFTGVTIWGAGRGIDVGRGNAADVDPTRPGAENWGGPPIDNPQGAGVIRDVNGQTITDGAGTPLPVPNTNNFLLWWDGDLTRELLDRNYINKWDWTDGSSDRLLTASFVATSQGTKQFPALTGDFLGDWREEVVWKSADSRELRIYTTTIAATNRISTLMHDAQYRIATAWQGNAYNQPPHPSFFIGAGMSAPPAPNITTPQSADVAPGAPANVQATVISPNQVQVTWNAVPGATSYRLKRSDDPGGPFKTIAGGLTALGYRDETVSAGGAYYYVVTAVTGIRESDPSAEASAATALPAPWTAQDIGNVVATGRTTYANGVFAVRGAGASSGDGLRLVWQDLSGDHTLVVRVDSKSTNVGGGGLTFRKSLASNAAYATVMAEPTNLDRIFFRWRSGDGGGESYAVAYNALPVWLKLTRTGNTFAAFYSVDGAAWTQIGVDRTITMPTTVPGGLTVTGSSAEHTTASFSNVQLIPSANAAPRALGGTHLWQTSPNRLTFSFSEDVGASLSASDFVITLLGGGTITPTGFTYDPAINLATLTLPSALADGNYRATISSADVTDGAGVPLASSLAMDFFVLGGDANRDRVVDITDLGILATNWQQSPRVFSQGDFNGDGVVDITDLGLLATNWQKTQPAPAAPATSALFSPRRIATRAIDQIKL